MQPVIHSLWAHKNQPDSTGYSIPLRWLDFLKIDIFRIGINQEQQEQLLSRRMILSIHIGYSQIVLIN